MTTTEEQSAEAVIDAILDGGRTHMADRIELRRFVGREFLLWLWLESEIFDATLETKEHGQFGMWLEGRLVLNEGKESTVIKGVLPAAHREAKESLLRAKTVDRAGLHLSFGDHECTLTLRGDTLGIAGLIPPKKPKEEPDALRLDQPPPKRKSKKKEADANLPSEIAHESFYDRMHFTRDVEALLTALYRDFLTLRLSAAWNATVLPILERWVAGKDIDADKYKSQRERALAQSRRN
jgi:hypothetical protein